MSSARDPKFLADGPFESLRGGPGLVEVREARLGEVRLTPAFAAEFRRDRLEDLGDVDGDVGSRETTRRTSFGALAHRIAVARASDAIALDIDIMNPTPSATSCFTRGQAIRVVWTASRAFAAACSSVDR